MRLRKSNTAQYPQTFFAVRVWDPIQLSWKRLKGSYSQQDEAVSIAASKAGKTSVLKTVKSRPGKFESLQVWCSEDSNG